MAQQLGDRASVKGVDRKINDPTTMWGKHFTLYTFTDLTDWECITTGLTGNSDRSLWQAMPVISAAIRLFEPDIDTM